MAATLLLQIIEISAVIASAFSGLFEARKKRMDFVGVYAVALITAFGGGTLRDVLLNRRPLYWIEHDYLAVVIFAICIGALYLSRGRRMPQMLIDVPDALGLGLFSITGAYYAVQGGTSLFIASLFGVITGVFGGVLRDVVCNEIPAVFSAHTSLYATCSFAGTWVYLGMYKMGATNLTATIATLAVTFALRMIAIRYDVRLPMPLDERKT